VKKLETAKVRRYKSLITNGGILCFGAFCQFFHSFSVKADRARHSVRAEVPPSESGAQGTDAPYQRPATRPSPLATHYGRPYFVMELVRGIKITEYCDQNNLSTQDRLKLFTQVCQAIQHAHQGDR